MRYENELNSIINRFRDGSGDFGDYEEKILKEIIEQDNCEFDTQSAIQIYSYFFKPDSSVLSTCKRYTVEIMSPGISSVCFKALFRYWCIFDEIYIDAIGKFLRPALWDEFYDEIYFLIRFLNGQDGMPFKEKFIGEISILKKWAIETKANDLLDAWEN